MDKKFIKTIISTKEGRDDRLIKRGDLVDWELMKEFCDAQSSRITKAFYQYEDVLTGSSSKCYRIEIKCSECGKIHIKTTSKTGIIDTVKTINWIRFKGKGYSNEYYLLNRRKELFCEECLWKQSEKERKEAEESRKLRIETEKSTTERYIWQYLDPNRSFKEEVKAKEKIDSIMGVSFLDDEAVRDAICDMNYADFLKTPYWDGVRNYKLKRAKYCCQLCGNKTILNVHHKNYYNHGREHVKSIADNDLIVLCKDCHEKFHDKLNDGEVSA